MNDTLQSKPPLWEQCECCEDFLCNLHEVHVYDCACPDIDKFAELGIYPYENGSLEAYLATWESS